MATANVAGNDGKYGVYWAGANGHIYTKGNNGQVTDQGPGHDINGKGFDANVSSEAYRRIDDPNPPKQAQNQNTNNVQAPGNSTGGGGSTGPVYADKSNDIALNNAGLGSVDNQTNMSIDKVNKAVNDLIGNYDTEAGANKTRYTNSSNENQDQFQTSKQTALVNAAQGRQGLLGTLAGIGALSGDGITQANQAVQHGANEDLATGGNTYATNQSGLDTAFNAFKLADEERRKTAETARTNDIQSAQNSGAVTKQKFLTGLADDYTAEGKGDQAKTYATQAAALYPTIANTNVPNMSITPQAAAYTPASLASYLNNSNTQISGTSASPVTTGAASIPGLSALGTTKKQTATI